MVCPCHRGAPCWAVAGCRPRARPGPSKNPTGGGPAWTRAAEAAAAAGAGPEVTFGPWHPAGPGGSWGVHREPRVRALLWGRSGRRFALVTGLRRSQVRAQLTHNLRKKKVHGGAMKHQQPIDVEDPR